MITLNINKDSEQYQILLDGPIPPIGSNFSFYSSRDALGDYRQKPFDPAHQGDVREVISGRVQSIDYLVEETGDSLQTNNKSIYIEIYLV